MTIRTIEQDVPGDLPPSRLFLDDLEEIVQILTELVQSQKKEADNLIVRFSAANKECDIIADLPKILGNTRRDLKIRVSGSSSWVETSIRFSPWFSASWWSRGCSKQDTWAAYHKLEPIFKRRKRAWSEVVHSLPFWTSPIVGLAFVVLIEVASSIKSPVPKACAFVMILVLAFVVASGVRHTTIALRNSWEPTPVWVYIKERILPVLIGAGLGIFGTLLGLYIKHKFWP